MSTLTAAEQLEAMINGTYVNENQEVENKDNTSKVANTVEKLQKRLDKLTGDKHDLEEE